MKGAPVLSVMLFLLGCFVATYISRDRLSHRDSQIESLREQVRLYEVKLEVTSPDQAIEKITALHESLDRAEDRIQDKSCDYCCDTPPRPPASLMEPPQEGSYLKEMEGLIHSVK